MYDTCNGEEDEDHLLLYWGQLTPTGAGRIGLGSEVHSVPADWRHAGAISGFSSAVTDLSSRLDGVLLDRNSSGIG